MFNIYADDRTTLNIIKAEVGVHGNVVTETEVARPGNGLPAGELVLLRTNTGGWTVGVYSPTANLFLTPYSNYRPEDIIAWYCISIAIW